MAEKETNHPGGRMLRALRRAKGLTQTELGMLVGFKRDIEISEFELGERDPSVSKLQQILDELDLSRSQADALFAAYREWPGSGGVFPEADVRPWSREDEVQLIATMAEPSLTIGNLNLNTKLLPSYLWKANRKRHRYLDDPEEFRRGGCGLYLEWTGENLPQDLQDRLMSEMSEYLEQYTGDITATEYQDTKEVFETLSRQGSNPYPRIVAVPDIVTRDGGEHLRIRVNESKYGIALVEEKKLMRPTAIEFRSQYALSALAIRVAYVFGPKDGPKWVECHQRQGRVNATWPYAWDVGGAGYVNSGVREHKDPDDETIVSPWQAAVDEISKELNIHSSHLPHRDSYYFFGVANDKPTDHLILIGCCDTTYEPAYDRKPTPRVAEYGRCQLNPEDVATFIADKKHWVPAALLTLVCTLQYFAKDYSLEDIEKAFSSLEGKINLAPREEILPAPLLP